MNTEAHNLALDAQAKASRAGHMAAMIMQCADHDFGSDKDAQRMRVCAEVIAEACEAITDIAERLEVFAVSLPDDGEAQS